MLSNVETKLRITVWSVVFVGDSAKKPTVVRGARATAIDYRKIGSRPWYLIEMMDFLREF